MRYPTTTKWIVAALLAATPMLAQAKTPDPARILRLAKAAQGGAALDKETGSYEEGVHGPVHYKTWLNHRGYGMRSDSERDGKRSAFGFNGKVQWRQAPDGKVTIDDDPVKLREAITTAYVSADGFLHPDDYPATFRYLRGERSGKRTFDAIEISPQGGRPFELWFDRRTHLMARIVDPTGDPPVWVDLQDRHIIDGASVPMRGVIHKIGDNTVLDTLHVGHVVFRDVPLSTYDPPVPE